MSKKESAGSWGEVCQKVSYGDGLYMTCREKVTGFDGFQNNAFDQGAPEDFTAAISKTAVNVPEPPQMPARHQAEPQELEGGGSFLEDVMDNKMLLYGGIALVVYLVFLRGKQEIATTDSGVEPVANTPVTTTKAA